MDQVSTSQETDPAIFFLRLESDVQAMFLSPGGVFPISITSGLTLQHCGSPVKMYYL